MLFQFNDFLDLPPQYNIFPGADIYAVRGIILREEQVKKTSAAFQKEVVPMRWGLIPFWTKDPEIGSRMINSRAETIAEKPAFRKAFKDYRCLIPADGFFEWQKTKEGEKKPYYIHMKEDKPFALAGIYDKWKNPEGRIIESCSILTTNPNNTVKPIHDRMPVIINPKDFDQWINPEIKEVDDLRPLLKPFDDSVMEAYPVSLFINNPQNEGPKCIARLAEKSKQQQLF